MPAIFLYVNCLEILKDFLCIFQGRLSQRQLIVVPATVLHAFHNVN